VHEGRWGTWARTTREHRRRRAARGRVALAIWLYSCLSSGPCDGPRPHGCAPRVPRAVGCASSGKSRSACQAILVGLKIVRKKQLWLLKNLDNWCNTPSRAKAHRRHSLDMAPEAQAIEVGACSQGGCMDMACWLVVCWAGQSTAWHVAEFA